MTAVIDLLPGNVVDHFGRSATFITQCPHPKYDGFALVVWRLDDGTTSLDALSPLQHIGVARPQTGEERIEALERALNP